MKRVGKLWNKQNLFKHKAVKFASVLMFLLVLGGMTPCPDFSTSASDSLEVFFPNSRAQAQSAQDFVGLPVFIDGEEVTDGLLPRLENDRLFGPVRNLSEQLGASVKYEAENREAILTRPDVKVVLTVNNDVARVYRDDEAEPEHIPFDAPMFIDDEIDEAGGRAYAPLRFLAEQFGYKVQYHHDTRTVDIFSDPAEEEEKEEQEDEADEEDKVDLIEEDETEKDLGEIELGVSLQEEKIDLQLDFSDQDIPEYEVIFDEDSKSFQIIVEAKIEEERSLIFDDPLLKEVTTRFITAADSDDYNNEMEDPNNQEYIGEITGTKIVATLNYTIPEIKQEESGGRLKITLPRIFKEKIEKTELAEGFVHKAFRKGVKDGPMAINELWLDPDSNIQPSLALANDRLSGLERLDDMAKRHDALAAVNGGYFASNGYPIGLFINNNQLIWKPLDGRTALFVTEEEDAIITQANFERGELVLRGEDGAVQTTLPVSKLNRSRRSGETVVYTVEYGNSTGTSENEDSMHKEFAVYDGEIINISEGDTLIPKDGFVFSMHEDFVSKMDQKIEQFDEGAKVELDWDLGVNLEVQDIAFALNGGPGLVENGRVNIKSVEENIAQNISTGRHPRTAVGTTAEGEMVITTVDGRRDRYVSLGMTLEELAEYKQTRGIHHALNLDGGGSTMMWFDGAYQNQPSGWPRWISNGILFK